MLFCSSHLQRSAKIIFLGCVTRPHTQRQVTQHRKYILADLCIHICICDSVYSCVVSYVLSSHILSLDSKCLRRQIGTNFSPSLAFHPPLEHRAKTSCLRPSFIFLLLSPSWVFHFVITYSCHITQANISKFTLVDVSLKLNSGWNVLLFWEAKSEVS